MQGDFDLARVVVGKRAEMGPENLEEGVGREILPVLHREQVPMASHSVGRSDKMGSSGKHYVQGICEMRDQKGRVFSGKTANRELLTVIPWKSR